MLCYSNGTDNNSLNNLVVLCKDRHSHSSSVSLYDNVINGRPSALFTDTQSERQIQTVAEPLVV